MSLTGGVTSLESESVNTGVALFLAHKLKLIRYVMYMLETETSRNCHITGQYYAIIILHITPCHSMPNSKRILDSPPDCHSTGHNTVCINWQLTLG